MRPDCKGDSAAAILLRGFMTVQAESEPLAQAPGISIDALAALARAVADAAARPNLTAALQDVVGAARASTGADVGLARVLSGDRLETVAVSGSAALAAELEGDRVSAAELARRAAGVVGAPAALLWQRGEGDALELVGSHGLDPATGLGDAAELAAAALEDGGSIRAIASDRLPNGCGISTTLALGEPPIGFLQLLFDSGAEPGADQLGRLTIFGVRAAHVLRSGVRARELELELEQSRALLTVVGQATAELSLTHTLETAVARIAELLDVERVAVYLRATGDRLTPAAGYGLTGPHTRVAERLLELGIGPGRRRHPLVEVSDTDVDFRLGDARDAAHEAGIHAALAVPLLVRDDVIGLLAVYPDRGRAVSESESALLSALASQLAVAVQNAQLHERTAELSTQREAALASEREAARRLGALYEISRSFAQSLSLDKTLDALAKTIVDVLDVDAAVIGMPDDP